MKRGIIFLIFILLVSSVVTQAKTPLVVWDWWGAGGGSKHQAWFSWLESEFEKQNPDIDLQFQFYGWDSYLDKIITATAGGVGPDAAQLSVNFARDLYDAGMLAELNDFVAKCPDTAPRQFIPTTQVYNQKNGRIYGITFVMDSGALAYNKDHFAEAGLSEDPFALATWADFTTAAKKLTRSDGETIVRSGYSYWISMEVFASWLVSNGGSYYNDNLTGAGFNNKAGIETLTLLQDLKNAFDVWGGSAWQFEAGDASMAYAGTWSGSYWDTVGSLRFGLTSNPKGPSATQRGTVTWGNMFSMFTDTQHPEEAWRFIRFATGLDAQIWLLDGLDRPTSPRLDFYRTSAWKEAVLRRPWVATMPDIAMAGGVNGFLKVKDINAVAQPILGRVESATVSPTEALIQIEQAVNRYLQ